jgi:hypothetical protein
MVSREPGIEGNLQLAIWPEKVWTLASCQSPAAD